MDNRPIGCNRVSIPTGKYHPKIKPSAYHRWLPQSRLRRASSLPEGAMGLVPCHIGLLGMRSACCESQPRLTPCQLPLTREPFCARYRFIVRYRTFSIFQSTAWERSTPKNHDPKRGQRPKPTTRAKAKGQSRLVPPGGFFKGGTIRAGASCSPLEPASLLPFLPEQERKAPLASGRSRFRTIIFCESLLPLQSPVSAAFPHFFTIH